jgi:putative transposase
MARRPRLALAGHLHHLRLRGHSGQPVFVDDLDRAAFLTLLQEPARRLGVAIHAYALLEREVHLLVTPSVGEALGRLVQSVGRSYVAAFNRRHQRTGTAWDGRFRNSLLDADTLLWPATLFIEGLPVHEKLVSSALDWTWSSAQHHAGKRRDPLLVDHPLYWRLGNTPFERELAHTHALVELERGSVDSRFAAAVDRMAVLGSPAFLASVEKALQRPVAVRAPGRPRAQKSVPIAVQGIKTVLDN